MGNGCCGEAFGAATGAADQNTEAAEETALMNETQTQNDDIIAKLETQLEEADDQVTELTKIKQDQIDRVSELESELDETKTLMQESEQRKLELQTEFDTFKQSNMDKTEEILSLTKELNVLQNSDASVRMKKLESELDKLRQDAYAKGVEQGKTIAKLAKQCKRLRDENAKKYTKGPNGALQVSNEYSPMMSDNEEDYGNDEENKYDELEEDLQKILFAEEYTVIFNTKPFGFTFGTNKKLYKDTKNLFVKHVDRGSEAYKKSLIIGSKLVKFNEEIVEDMGGKAIQSLFHTKYYSSDQLLPLKITFKKPIFANSHFQRIYELEAELETVLKNLKRTEKERNALSERLNSLSNEMETLKNINSEQNETIAQLKQSLEESRANESKQKQEIFELQSELSNAQNKISFLERENNEKIHELIRYKSELQNAKMQSIKERERLKELQSKSKDTTYSLSELENKNTALVEAIAELKTNLRDQKVSDEQRKYVSSKMAFIQGANTEQTRFIQKLEEELAMAKNKMASMSGKVNEEAESIIRVQKERINELSRELTNARVRIDELETKNVELDRLKRKLDYKVKEAKRDKHIIYVEKGVDYEKGYNVDSEMKNEEYFEMKSKEFPTERVGLQREDMEKNVKKYNLQMEAKVVHWVNDVLSDTNSNMVLGGGPDMFQKSLQNGVILCEMINFIKPKSVKNSILKAKVGQSGAMAAFADKQRVAAFARATKELGFDTEYTFEADDLCDGRNMTAVLFSLWAFGGFCRRKEVANTKGGI